ESSDWLRTVRCDARRYGSELRTVDVHRDAAGDGAQRGRRARAGSLAPPAPVAPADGDFGPLAPVCHRRWRMAWKRSRDIRTPPEARTTARGIQRARLPGSSARRRRQPLAGWVGRGLRRYREARARATRAATVDRRDPRWRLARRGPGRGGRGGTGAAGVGWRRACRCIDRPGRVRAAPPATAVPPWFARSRTAARNGQAVRLHRTRARTALCHSIDQ